MFGAFPLYPKRYVLTASYFRERLSSVLRLLPLKPKMFFEMCIGSSIGKIKPNLCLHGTLHRPSIHPQMGLRHTFLCPTSHGHGMSITLGLSTTRHSGHHKEYVSPYTNKRHSKTRPFGRIFCWKSLFMIWRGMDLYLPHLRVRFMSSNI